MEKLKLTVKDAYQLQGELQGFLTEKLPLIVKFRVTQWFNDLQPKLKAANDVRSDLLKKHSDGTRIDPVLPTGEKNPKYTDYMKEFEPILDSEIELEYDKLKLSAIADLQTHSNYPTVYKMLDANE